MPDGRIRMLDLGSDAGPPLGAVPAGADLRATGWLDDDPATVILTCANCGAPMDERKCKLICRCGYFLSCSDYY